MVGRETAPHTKDAQEKWHWGLQHHRCGIGVQSPYRRPLRAFPPKDLDRSSERSFLRWSYRRAKILTL
jgi:hypothetical protein